MNTFGRMFRLTTFGESHGDAIGGVIDGCPPGFKIDIDGIAVAIERRRGKGGISTTRAEKDLPKFLSGLFEGATTGTPIAFIIPNENHSSHDYDHLRTTFRPSHADYTYHIKYGIRDHRGGGRASARETLVRVIAGEIARQILAREGIRIVSYTASVGSLSIPGRYCDGVTPALLEGRAVGCPDETLDREMYDYLTLLRSKGDTSGGVVATSVTGVPGGIGSPLYEKLDARLASAMLSIGAAKAFEVGDGFALAEMCGSVANDSMTVRDGQVHTVTNRSGGILGGISNGEEIRFRVAFKPIASIATPQQTVTTEGAETELNIGGRHDASVFPRVLPVVEAMTALVIIDELLVHRAQTTERESPRIKTE